MANKLPVKFYYNTMPGMPQITNVYGETLTVLDCVLVNGTTPATVNSITFADGVCTATTAAAHGFIIDMVIEISGATQDEYNGEYRITEVTTNTFKYVPTVFPGTGSATGTLRVRIPPLGYEIAFTATNRRVYRSKNVLSTRPYLKVDCELKPNWDDNYTIVSRVTAAKAMTDIDTFTDGRIPFDPANPTMNDIVTGSGRTAIPGWFWWYQSMDAWGTMASQGKGTNANRDWTIVGDDRTFYFVINAFSNSTPQGYGCSHYGFGEFNSLRKNDPYNYMLISTESRTTANNTIYSSHGNDCTRGNDDTTGGMILAKNSFNVGDYTNFSLHHIRYRGNSTVSGRHTGLPFPNQPDYSVRFSTRYICDTARGDVRGTMPGQYYVQQQVPFGHRTVVNDVYIDGGTEKRKMLTLRSAYSTDNGVNTLLAYDITGPWR